MGAVISELRQLLVPIADVSASQACWSWKCRFVLYSTLWIYITTNVAFCQSFLQYI